MAERVAADQMSVCQCLYNPSWKWGMLPDGNMLLRLAHPEFGDMDFIVTKETAGLFRTFLDANFEAIAPVVAGSERLQ